MIDREHDIEDVYVYIDFIKPGKHDYVIRYPQT